MQWLRQFSIGSCLWAFGTCLWAIPSVIVEEVPAEVVAPQPHRTPGAIAPRPAESLPAREHPLSTPQDTLRLSQRIEELSQEISELRGQLEEQQHRLALFEKQQGHSSATRIGTAVPVAPTPLPVHSESVSKGDPTPPPAPVSQPVAPPADTRVYQTAAETPPAPTPAQQLQDQKMYMVAYEHLKAKAYPQAAQALHDYLSHYPEGRYRVHAHYWLGEVYFMQSQFDLAHEQFRWIIDKASDNPKAGDALLKIGLIQANQQKTQEARKTLQQVKKRYPESMVSRLADARLAQLQQPTAIE